MWRHFLPLVKRLPAILHTPTCPTYTPVILHTHLSSYIPTCRPTHPPAVLPTPARCPTHTHPLPYPHPPAVLPTPTRCPTHPPAVLPTPTRCPTHTHPLSYPHPPAALHPHPLSYPHPPGVLVVELHLPHHRDVVPVCEDDDGQAAVLHVPLQLHHLLGEVLLLRVHHQQRACRTAPAASWRSPLTHTQPAAATHYQLSQRLIKARLHEHFAAIVWMMTYLYIFCVCIF